MWLANFSDFGISFKGLALHVLVYKALWSAKLNGQAGTFTSLFNINLLWMMYISQFSVEK